MSYFHFCWSSLDLHLLHLICIPKVLTALLGTLEEPNIHFLNHVAYRYRNHIFRKIDLECFTRWFLKTFSLVWFRRGILYLFYSNVLIFSCISNYLTSHSSFGNKDPLFNTLDHYVGVDMFHKCGRMLLYTWDFH